MSFNSDLDEHNLNIDAKELSYVLEHQKVSRHIKNSLLHIITVTQNESELDIAEPFLLPLAYPVMIERLGDYGRGVNNAVKEIIDSYAGHKTWLYEELKQIRIPFHEARETAKQTGLEELAEQISIVLSNRFLPTEIRDDIKASLCWVIDGAKPNSPQWVLENLKELKKRGKTK